MSRELKVILWCDQCPPRTSEAVVTRTISWDGDTRELDVCAKHDQVLEETLRPALDAGRHPGSEPPAPGAKPLTRARERTRAMRKWAAENGYGDFQSGGYIPKEVRDAFAAYETSRRSG